MKRPCSRTNPAEIPRPPPLQARILATLRNLAIGIIRHITFRTVNIAAATRQPDLTLDLLGIPPPLCK